MMGIGDGERGKLTWWMGSQADEAVSAAEAGGEAEVAAAGNDSKPYPGIP
jgi:hypothetical protein